MRFGIDKYCINENDTIRKAMKNIDKNLIGAVFVIDDNNIVKGIITDGIIRRALLKGFNIESSINKIYNKDFKWVDKLTDKRKVKEMMIKYKIRQVPVLDKNRKFEELYFLDDIISYNPKDNYVFILAGGLGTRLRPLTETTPKPMLKVGDKPILQRIIEQFKEYGFKNFLISINYKGKIIEEYFKDGKHLEVNIEYVKETQKLGTAGSIKLAQNKLTKPFIVINGDILTGVDFDKFLNYHINNKFDITVGVRNYDINIPYGVVITEERKIKSLKEKPTYSFYVNSGVYAINPENISYIPENKFYNMTELIDYIKDQEYKKAGVYMIKEYWTDIGQIDDYKKANEDIEKLLNI